MSVARHHSEWLWLVESSGPFLSIPVLMRVFPQGLDQRDPEKAKELRLAYDEWQDNPEAPGRHRAWVDFVLKQLLEFPASTVAEGQAIPAGLQAHMVEYAETLRPDLAITAPVGQSDPGAARLLVQIYPPGQDLDSPAAGKHWKTSPATRMTELLHASDVPLGLATNGEHWMLVFAPRGETTGYASWYASLWQEEPITLRAFHSLLHVRRFFGVAEGDTLFALLKESAEDQQEVTIQLGLQVRRAVEVLVQAIDRLDQDSGRRLLSGMDTKALYEASLTVMMRLVFLFSAEERGLLRLGEPLYDDNYAVSTLRERLRETADQHGEELLERRFDAWAQLLATFRAVHGGVTHESLRLPAYGGSLFDPDRYPFLEGRAPGSIWRDTPAETLAVNNRVVLHLLESLQLLQVKVPGGGPAEARRLSFRALDIEQIGHVYEGLLDHTAVRATTTVLGLQGTKSKEPEITLEQLEELLAQGEDKLIELLQEETKRSNIALRRALREPRLVSTGHNLLIACGQDTVLRDRILPFTALIREDSFQMPVVIRVGSVYVTGGTARRSTGTHYTPRSLTEPIVQHTMEPLVYEGPSEGWPKEQWRLKSPKEILSLRVCDMTMGSGAFLVQACRYLAERLVEAWETAEESQPGAFIVTPEGDISIGAATERLLSKDPAERLALARRFVADRCLFGVDINPMAVEMAKLSLWLITLQRDRPFTFLDHALKGGDSLLGICRFTQLETFSLDDAQAKQVLILSNYDKLIQAAIAKRRELEDLPSNDATQIAVKQVLNAEAEEHLSRLKLAADLLIAAVLTEATEQQKKLARVDAHLKVTEYIRKPLEEFRQFVREQLDGRCPFHWPLEFPEVFEQGGFDACVGNPPFMGGSKITIASSTEYRNYIVKYIAAGERGKADLCAFFVLRALALVTNSGDCGLIVTNSLSQGDTRRVSLASALNRGCVIYRADSNRPWPGSAGITVATIWLTWRRWRGAFTLDGVTTSGITSFLTGDESINTPHLLSCNLGKAFRGTEPKGLGFVLEFEEAEALVQDNPKNQEIIFPYITGQDLYSRPNQSASRMIINFQEWPVERAQQYRECFDRVTRLVKPYRDTITKQIHEPDFWKFWDKRLEKYKMISSLPKILARAYCGNMHAMSFLPLGIIYDTEVVVIAASSYEAFAVLQSTMHELWARLFGPAALRTDMRYATKLCFETFPFPQPIELLRVEPTSQVGVSGRAFYQYRSEVMLKSSEGLTRTYNRFHDSGEISEDFARLRALHVEMDQAVAVAYGWTDLDLGHSFHATKQGVRYTLSDPARRKVLNRLLALNHQRYEEEVKAGLHSKKGKATITSGKRSRKPKGPSSNPVLMLLE